MGANLRIGGVWASAIAGWGDLEWETDWGAEGCGLGKVSWAMEPQTDAGTDTWRHPALRPGQLVEVMDGPWCLGRAVIDEPDDTEGTYSARGLYREAEKYLALDGSGNAATVVDTAVDAAIARGLRWTRPAQMSIATVSGTGGTGDLNRLHTLLAEWAGRSPTLRWHVDGDGAVRAIDDPTAPIYYLTPGLTHLGRSADGYASTLKGRYRGSGSNATVTSTDAAAADEFGAYEDAVDLTSLGVISATRAQQTIDALMAKGRNRPSFTHTLEVTADQLLTAGGVPPDLSTVTAGQMVRSLGLVDDARVLDGRTYLDWVIGNTRYRDGADTITLAPLNLAAADLETVLRSLFPRARFIA